jgi:hypothetical protein
MMPPWRGLGGGSGGRKPKDGGPDGGSGGPGDRGPGSKRPIQRAGMGLLYLAIGRREGFEDFGNSADAYLASLAPLLAFDLVSNAIMAASGAIHAAALIFLVTLCVILAPAVISHPLCRRWGVQENWPRYANIINWAVMLEFVLLGLAGALARLLVAGGAPQATVENGLRLAMVGYALWFHWFVARGALGISRWRTFGLLLACGAANVLVLAALLLMVGAKMKIG